MQSDPKVDFWISGSLQRASKVYEKDTDNSGDGTGGGGHTQWDAHAGHKGSRIIKSLTVTFTLEGPDRISIPGASATYRIDYEQLQRENTLSIYVAGSGLSFDKNLTVTQNLDDALFDATAASVIHLLGEALLIPFDHCSKVFQHDPQLDKRLRDSLTQMTKGALEQTLKIWLFVGNYPVDESDLLHMTDNDRALVKTEMHHGAHPMTEDGVIDFAVSLWQDLDYAKGAPRVERVLAQIARDQAAQKEREEQAKIIEQRRQIEAQRAAEEKAKQDKIEQERKAAAEKAAALKEEKARAAKAAFVIRQTSKRIRAKNTAPCGSKQTASPQR